jgi:glycogen synthase
MSLRILHVLDHSIPLHSGYTFRTAAILREQRASGLETFHLTSPKHTASSASEEDVDGLHFFRTTGMTSRWLDWPIARELALMHSLEQRLEDVVASVRPDILHAHSPVLNAVPAIRVGRRHRIPVVYEVRAFWEDAAVDHGSTTEGSLRYRATRALETWALRRADAVTCICEGLRADILARGVAEQCVTVIPNAVDIGAFRFCEPADAALRRSLGLDGKVVLGFVGSFYAYEGLDLLLDALPQMASSATEVRLLLVGGGPQEDSLRRQVQRLGIADRVIFTGRVPHGDVHRYYGLVDVLAYPRRAMRLTDLVTPLKPLEAMAQGRLLVASDVGGHRELIRDGETGILFQAGDARELAGAVHRMLAMKDRWAEIRANGRQFVENERNWTSSVRRYLPVYERLRHGATA